ncbi:MAG: plasmid mobilization relaxosome protein MobC [Lachnospiraceae bacterium]|nr:plasmid mobilization relaxosome protein MobC [Lachnospiraceae bacterium]
MNGKKSAPCGLKSQSTVVAGKKRIRNTPLYVWLSSDERAKIQECMADTGIRNFSAYVRKIALNGYVLHVDLAPVKNIVSLHRRCANNLNQIAVRANTYSGVCPEEIRVLQKDYADLWGPLSELLEKLSEVVAL